MYPGKTEWHIHDLASLTDQSECLNLVTQCSYSCEGESLYVTVGMVVRVCMQQGQRKGRRGEDKCLWWRECEKDEGGGRGLICIVERVQVER